MYKNGIETKENIIKSAKKHFFDLGYRDATVNRICRDCGIKLGTFTYYYSKKEDLLREIYSAYMESCRQYVDGLGLDLPPAQHHLYVVMLYYMNLYKDPAVIRFHREILDMVSMNIIFENPRHQIEDFSEEASIPRDDKYYTLAVIADNAVRRELNINFIDRGCFSGESIKNLVGDIYHITGKLFGTNQDSLESYLEKAYDFALSHPDANVGLLK